MGFTRDGDGSTLTLDFTQGILDSRITFTRASTATFTSVGNLTDPTLTIESVGGGANGDWDDPNIWDIGKSPRDGQVLVTILVGDTITFNDYNTGVLLSTAGVNQPRFDHDPTTGAPRGLLIEGSATNYALQFTTWGRSNINGSGNAGALAYGQVGPDSSANTAARITTAATTTFSNMRISFGTNAAGASRTFSVWLRGVSGNTTASIAINGSSTPTGVASSQSGYPVTLTTSTSGNNLFALVTGLSTTAWTRVAISRTDTQSSSDDYRICPGDHTNTISSGLAIDLYVPQIENGIGMSSAIPTTTSQVTRAADNCQIVSANFAPWYGTPIGFTIVADMTPQSRAAGSSPGMLALRSAADSGLRMYYYNDGLYNAAFRFGTASTSADVFSPNNVTYGVPRKFGASVTSGTQFASSAGVQMGTTQTLAVPMDQILLAIGSDGLSPTPNINCRMHFRTIKYWPYAMTLEDLNARTT